MATLSKTSIGEYQLIDFLGAGGMGEVYRAVHAKIGRVVAIKVLTTVGQNGNFVARFFNEARIQARLQHPNLATLYDFAVVDGKPCIIMEYVDGQTLAERIQARGALPLRRAVPLFQAVVEALAYVHRQGILHRDIKPTNIKITTAGAVKLLDFGIARAETAPRLTSTGRYIGTLPYLAPEALAGKMADVRTDVWSLGVVFYEMITGKSPFVAATLDETLTRISKAAFAPASLLNPVLPREVDGIISRCLRPDPAERYQSACEVLAGLRRLTVVGSPSRMSMSGSRGLASRASAALTAARRQWPLLLAVAALVLTVTVGVFLPKGGAAGKSAVRLPRDSSISQEIPEGAAPPQEVREARRKRVQIDVVEGPAEVYHNGEKVGRTPYLFTGAPGKSAHFVLKRPGYKDKEVPIHVLENDHLYTYVLEKTED